MRAARSSAPVQALAAVALALWTALPVAAAPACGGRDLRERFVAEDPQTLRDIDATAAATPFGQGRLFRISRPGLAPSWLFGTMHVSDPRATAMPPATSEALPRARVVALELEEADALHDPATMEKLGPRLLGYIVARPAERSDRLVSPAELARIEEALVQRGQPRALARTMKPAVLVTMLALPACATSGKPDFVDALIARRARELGIRVAGLETLDQQLAALGRMTPETQRVLLASTVQMLDVHDDVYETMVRRYVAGEIGWMVAWIQSGRIAPGLTAPTPEAFMRGLLDERNVGMRDKAVPLIEAGGAFIAVGAAHVPGEAGLARLLEKAGYTVERVE